MKTSNLLLSAVLILASGLSGAALAHGDYDRGRGHRDHDRHYVYKERHRHGHGHRHRHEHYDYRPYWHDDRRSYRDHDAWYGIHLFLGGH